MKSEKKYKYSLFIGRWQPWHDGHRWLIDQRLNEGKKVCIAVRDTSLSDSNPFTAKQVKSNVENELSDLISSGLVKVVIIPDIESINYGRGVGYVFEEESFDEEISSISATKIRSELREKGKL